MRDLELYFSRKGFLVKDGNQVVAASDFADMVTRIIANDLTEIEERYARNLLGEHVAGETIVLPWDGSKLLLGPLRDFTHEVTLFACGNPDFGQYSPIGPRKRVKVVGIDEAVAAVKAYQRQYDMGGGNCGKGHGVVYQLPQRETGRPKKVGAITYGGHFYTLKEYKATFKVAI